MQKWLYLKTTEMQYTYIAFVLKLFIYPPLSIARYSFIQLCELGQPGVNKKTCQRFEMIAIGSGGRFTKINR